MLSPSDQVERPATPFCCGQTRPTMLHGPLECIARRQHAYPSPVAPLPILAPHKNSIPKNAAATCVSSAPDVIRPPTARCIEFEFDTGCGEVINLTAMTGTAEGTELWGLANEDHCVPSADVGLPAQPRWSKKGHPDDLSTASTLVATSSPRTARRIASTAASRRTRTASAYSTSFFGHHFNIEGL